MIYNVFLDLFFVAVKWASLFHWVAVQSELNELCDKYHTQKVLSKCQSPFLVVYCNQLPIIPLAVHLGDELHFAV